jgi:DNA topoisomerase-1
LLKDRRLARIVKRCQDIPGYALFQYYDEDGEPKAVDSSDVNTYLQDITGKSFTAKVFRTWGGSVLSVKYLCEDGKDSDIETSVRDCIEHVSNALGNTKATCKDYYIHPYILDAYRDGSLQAIYEKCQSNDDDLSLSCEEQTLMKLIE